MRRSTRHTLLAAGAGIALSAVARSTGVTNSVLLGLVIATAVVTAVLQQTLP